MIMDVPSNYNPCNAQRSAGNDHKMHHAKHAEHTIIIWIFFAWFWCPGNANFTFAVWQLQTNGIMHPLHLLAVTLLTTCQTSTESYITISWTCIQSHLEKATVAFENFIRFQPIFCFLLPLADLVLFGCCQPCKIFIQLKNCLVFEVEGTS